jgi:hypothetical protein
MSTQSVDIKDTYFKMAAIVDQFCNSMDLSVNHYFQKYLSLAKWGYVQLGLKTANEPKTVLLDVSDVYTVTLPGDAIDWTKIAEPYYQYVKTLSVNSDLSKQDRTVGNPQFTNGVPPGWLPNGIDIRAYGGYEFANYGGSSLFSVGGGLPNIGHFTTKRNNSGCIEILLDSSITCPQVYVEYIGLPINPCGETYVSPYVAEWVRLFLNHEFEKNPVGRQRTQADIIRTGRELWHQEMVTRAAFNGIDRETFLTLTRKYYRLNPNA